MVDILLDLNRHQQDCLYVNNFKPTIMPTIIKIEEQFIEYFLEFIKNINPISQEHKDLALDIDVKKLLFDSKSKAMFLHLM